MENTRTIARAPRRLPSAPWAGFALMLALAGLLAAGLVAEAWVSGPSATSYPGVAYRLKALGLVDVSRSPAFVALLGLLALHLLWEALAMFPTAWREARLGVPAPYASESRARALALEGQLRAEVRPEVEAERFRTEVLGWARSRLGSARLIQRSGEEGGMEIAARRGRFGLLAEWVAVAGALVALGGAAASRWGAVSAVATVEEGARAGFVELKGGEAPAAWAALEIGGRAQPGFYVPGFAIELVELDRSTGRAALRFVDPASGEVVDARRVAPGAPTAYRGWDVHLGDIRRAADTVVNLGVTDGRGVETRFERLGRGARTSLDDYRFEVLEIRPRTDLSGASVRIEYRPRGGEAERFWVFEEFPDYDFAHRKKSARHFTLERARARSVAELRLGRDPGAPWLWAGLALLAAGLLGSLGPSSCRYWLVWNQGTVKVMGWSAQPFLFEPLFRGAVAELDRRLQREAGSPAPEASREPR